MKATTPTNQTLTLHPVTNNLPGVAALEENFSQLKNFPLPDTETEPQIAPPAYMWDRIAGVLDEQDRKKELLDYTQSLLNPKPVKTTRKLLKAVAGFSFCIGLYWLLS